MTRLIKSKGDPILASEWNQLVTKVTRPDTRPNTVISGAIRPTANHAPKYTPFQPMQILSISEGENGPLVTYEVAGGTYLYNGVIRTVPNQAVEVEGGYFLSIGLESGYMWAEENPFEHSRWTESHLLGQFQTNAEGPVEGQPLLHYSVISTGPSAADNVRYAFEPHVFSTYVLTDPTDPSSAVYTYYVQIMGGLVQYSSEAWGVVSDPEPPEITTQRQSVQFPDGTTRVVIVSTTLVNQEDARAKQYNPETDFVYLKTQFGAFDSRYGMEISTGPPADIEYRALFYDPDL